MENSKLSLNMTPKPFVGHPNFTLEQIDQFMRTSRVRHLPIIDNGNVVGVVDDHMMKQFRHLLNDDNLCAEDVMNKSPIIVEETTPVKLVAQKMSSTKQDCALVVDAKGQLIGIFTSSDALQMLSMILRTSPDIFQGSQSIEDYCYPIRLEE